VYNRNSAFSYLGVCTDPKIVQLVTAAHTTSGGSGALNFTATDVQVNYGTTCHSNATGWAISAPLASNNAAWWCVDSNGFVASTTARLLTAATVPLADVTCN